MIRSGGFEELKNDPNALRVVVDINAKNVVPYKLANPDENGLCQAIQMDIEEVWWAPEYRDDGETRIEQRRQKWTSQVMEHIHEAFVGNVENQSRPSRYTNTLPANPAQDSVDERLRIIRWFVEEYRITESSEALKTATETFKGTVDQDLQEQSIQGEHSSVNNFLGLKHEMSEEDITQIEAWLRESIPALNNPENVKLTLVSLARAIRLAKKIVPLTNSASS